MKGFLNFLNLKFLPLSPDFGLLLLRVGIGGCMLFLHGWKKLELEFGLGGWAGKEAARKARIADFPDPIHLGPFHINSAWSHHCATFVEVVCSALLIIGFCSRFAAAGLVFVMSIAFFMAHKGALSGDRSGEMAAVYLIGFATILFAGPGKLSFDGNGGGGGGAGH